MAGEPQAHRPLQPFFDKLQSFVSSRRDRPPPPPPKPLLDIEDVRAFIRSISGGPKHELPRHGRSLPSRASTSYFGMGTMEPRVRSPPSQASFPSPQQGPIHQSLPQQVKEDEHDVHDETTDENENENENENDDEDDDDDDADDSAHGPAPLLDIEDARDAVQRFLRACGYCKPDDSWKYKLPWLVPRPPRLARGLQWPPDSFESKEQKREYYRQARKRKPFLMGSPPLWSVTAFNLGFIYCLMVNPLASFVDFITKF